MRQLLSQKEMFDRNAKLIEINRELRVKIIQSGASPIEAVKIPSTADLVAINTVLEDHLDFLLENFLTLTPKGGTSAEHVEALASENLQLRRKVAELTASIGERDTALSTLKSKYGDFDLAVSQAVSMAVAEHGINPLSVKKPAKATEESNANPGSGESGASVVGKNYTEEAMRYIRENGPVKIPIR